MIHSYCGLCSRNKKFNVEVQVTSPQHFWNVHHAETVLTSGYPTLLARLILVFHIYCPTASKLINSNYLPFSILNLGAFWDKGGMDSRNALCHPFFQSTLVGGWHYHNSDLLAKSISWVFWVFPNLNEYYSASAEKTPCPGPAEKTQTHIRPFPLPSEVPVTSIMTSQQQVGVASPSASDMYRLVPVWKNWLILSVIH